MYLEKIVLQNFRNYSQHTFEFHSDTTIIVGANTAGKTNLAEAILLLSTGKSFKADKDFEMIAFDKEVARVQGRVNNDENTKLEVTIAQGSATGGRFLKRFLVNDVPKSRNNFIGFLPVVLFRPEELDIIIDGPSVRRAFLDEVLEQVDSEYRNARAVYDKALRQRNALLDLAKETGRRNEQQFAYWDDLLIANGNIITTKREAFIQYVNESVQDIFAIHVTYDKSIISKERLLQYKDAEIGAGNTLVGPQRDDFTVCMQTENRELDIAHFGSRGQQRLAILQLKLLHLSYVEQHIKRKPVLVLDDIFSELDNSHIALVLKKVKGRQLIITTTHKEFIASAKLKDFAIIELKDI